MSGIDATSLMQMRGAILERSAALQKATAAVPAATAGQVDFGKMLSAVNTTQIEAGAASAAFERGDTSDIAGVMLARQKSGIAFEATLQVRNKLLSAYRDIMNMPV